VGSDRAIEVVDVMTGRAVGPPLRPDREPQSGVISPDGRRLLTFSPDGPAQLWDLDTGKSHTLSGPDEPVRRAGFHPNGRVLFTLGADSRVRLWDLTSEPLQRPPRLSAAAVAHAALSDDARWLCVLGADKRGEVLDFATGKLAGSSPPLEQAKQLAAISSDGQRFALVGADKVLRVWDVLGARWLGHPMRLGSTATHLAFSPNAEFLLSMEEDQAQVWNLATGAGVRLVGGVIRSPHFDPTGRRLIALDSAGTAHVWDTETGRRLTPPLKHSGPLHTAAFCDHGTRIITVSQRGTVSVWSLPEAGKGSPVPETRPLADLLAYTQLLAGGRIDREQWQPLAADELRAVWEGVRKIE
jgi:WD40 repeat protein